MKPFDQWSRELTDHLREKEEPKKISPEDLYSHKDVMRGEGITIATDYDPKIVKVLWNGAEFTVDGKEINSVADKYKGMDPPFGFNVDGRWFRDQDDYEEFLMLEEYAKLQKEVRELHQELNKAPLYMFGHNCTSMETVESISAVPDIDYNEVLPKNGKVYCTKEVLGETLSLAWVTTGDQYVITDVVGELVELTKVNKNG